VYNQVLSVLTNTQLSQIFEKMPGYDLRYLLQGSEKFVDNVLNLIDRDPSLTIGGVSGGREGEGGREREGENGRRKVWEKRRRMGEGKE
jgi:hypothetical protein